MTQSVLDILMESSRTEPKPRQEAPDDLRSAYFASLREKALTLGNEFDLNEADIRFSGVLQLNKVREALVAIIGAGGLGNWQWRILASMGFKRIAIYDDDTVGIENVGSQCHSVFDIGMPKVQAVQDACMAYRGIQIIARNKRVKTIAEISADLGEMPDIVIGCTDSTEFRNGFIIDLYDAFIHAVNEPNLTTHDVEKRLPELFIDYRMALGDWVAYLAPARALYAYSRDGNYPETMDFWSWYKDTAIFEHEDAVQEPCTERAIAYTGANVASYTGSLLHWLYSGGRSKLREDEFMYSFINGTSAVSVVNRSVSFSSRDFEFISETPSTRLFGNKMHKLRKEHEHFVNFVLNALGLYAVSERVVDYRFIDVAEDVKELCEQYIGYYALDITHTKLCLITDCGLLQDMKYMGNMAYSFCNYKMLSDTAYGSFLIIEVPPNSCGLVAMCQHPLGTVFQLRSNSEHRYFRFNKENMCIDVYEVNDGGRDVSDEVRDSGTGKKSIIRETLPLDAKSFAMLSLDVVEDQEEILKVLDEGKSKEELFNQVTAAQLSPGLVITLEDSLDAERFIVDEVGQHVLVHSCQTNPDDKFYLSSKSMRHMYVRKAVDARGEAQDEVQREAQDVVQDEVQREAHNEAHDD